jgi:hypothetical protein
MVSGVRGELVKGSADRGGKPGRMRSEIQLHP